MQKVMNIYQFKKGDIITRIKPLVETDGYKNYKYIGSKLEFLGILNATIYLKYVDNKLDKNPFAILFGIIDQKIEIPAELWEDGWSYYIEPNFLDEKTDEEKDEELESILNSMDKEEAKKYLTDAIQKASEAEEFEKANKLQQKLNELK